MTDNTTRTAAPSAAERSALLADLVDELTARAQAGEHLDAAALAAEHPGFADEIRQLLPAVGLLGELSRSRESLGVGHAAGVTGTLGDYRIVREVGRGGMGVVYEAEQVSLGRRVALKVLPFAALAEPRQLQRFKNEARAAAGLDHPAVVKVYGVGQERGVHFIAMQLIDGRSLADLIRERRGNPGAVPARSAAGGQDPTRTHAPDATGDAPAAAREPADGGAVSARTPADAAYARRVAGWGIRAAEALEHAHGLGVVPRDVKPGNLLLDGRGEVFVADFGLAKLASDPGVTGTGDILGTVRYMSPEQAGARHDLVDHRSDVYSLGVTLYELLTLTPAFDGTDRQDILSRVTDSDPAAPRSVDRRIPRDLETVVLKAMEKDPAVRYQSAKELADDLRRFLNHEPLRARPATLSQRVRKWGRRHPAAVRSAVLMLVLLTACSSLAAWLIWREQDRTARALAAETAARDRADEEKRVAQERDAETTTLLQFFEERVLAPPRPEGQEGGLGHDVRLRQAVEAALPAVALEFADKPLIEARLRRTIGLSFKYLGEWKSAAEQFEIARTLYSRHRGPDHPDTLAAANNLANSYTALGRHDEALRLLEESLAQRRSRLGPDHPDTLASENNLAIGYEKLGRHDDALELREEALRRTRSVLGPGHADALRGMNNLAISYTEFGRHDRALKLREEALELAEGGFGRGHVRTLPYKHNLAQTYAALGRDADAIRLSGETLEVARAKLPADHPNTLLVMNNLAWVLATASDARLRDPARAVELATRAAHKSPENADYRGTLGTARYRAGDWEQAADDLEEAIGLRKPDDPANANESFFLAMTRWQLGDRAAARSWFDKGAAWMDSGKLRKDEARRFRAEAAALLGLDDARQPPR